VNNSEWTPGREKDFLNDRPVQELSGIAKNRQRSLAALGALTFGHVAKLPSMLLIEQQNNVVGNRYFHLSSHQCRRLPNIWKSGLNSPRHRD